MNKEQFFNQILSPELAKPMPQFEEKCIVIGAGPSLKRKNQLQRLLESDFDGVVMVADYALIPTLLAGVTPDRYQKFFVCSQENSRDVAECYTHEIVRKYAARIKCIFISIHPFVLNECKRIGFDCYKINDSNPFHVLANIGAMGWLMGWKILGCTKIGLIGFDQGFYTDDLPHNFSKPLQDELYEFRFNKTIDCSYALDPLYEYYSKAFIDTIQHSPASISTFNCTEAGSLEGTRIINCTLEEFANE